MDGTKYVGMGVHTEAIGATVRNSAGKVTKELSLDVSFH
jgi:hypothetical protein